MTTNSRITTFAGRWALGLVAAGVLMSMAMVGVAAHDAELDDGAVSDAPQITSVTTLGPSIETATAVTGYEAMIADLQRMASGDEAVVAGHVETVADIYARAASDGVVTGYEAMIADLQAGQLSEADRED